jgi:Fe-S-cluster formation regulator IscX/YfhJ
MSSFFNMDPNVDPPLESVVDLEELYIWLQQFEDPPPNTAASHSNRSSEYSIIITV